MSRVFWKRWIAYIAVIAMLALILSACGGGQKTAQDAKTAAAATAAAATPAQATKPAEPAKTPEAAKPANVQVTAWLGSWWADEIPKIQEKFAAANPGYTVKIESVPINNYLENAITAIAGGNPPDALALDTLMVPTPVSKNLLRPLDDFMKKNNISKDIFAEAVYKAGEAGGKVYAVPYRNAPSVLMYNKTLFDKAGVKYPYDNMPLDEFLDISKKMTKPGEYYAYGIAATKSDPANVMTSFSPILWGKGGDFLTADMSKSALNTPESVAGIKFWVEMYTKHKVVPEGCINYAITKDLIPLFFNGQLAMVQMNDSNILKASDYAKKGGWEFATCIQPGPNSRGGGWEYTIPVTAKNVEAAEKYIAFFIKPEVLSAQHIIMPGVKAAQGGDYWGNAAFNIFYKALASNRALPPHPKWTEIQNTIVMELQTALQGAETPEQAAKNMDDKINAIIAAK